MQDMEFYQFHPTGIVGIGILLSEAARGEGGYLLNDDGQRFMERYAPTLMELAPRDMVSRAIYQEVRAGRGIGGKDYVYLDVRHLGRKVIEEKLPDITDFARVYQGVEPITEPVPIQPTAHYAMGGLPTNLDGQVIYDPEANVVPGFYSAGESACVSVHGANRLGTNSLVDLVVFGRRAGRHMLKHVQESDFVELPKNPEDYSRSQVDAVLGRTSGEHAASIRSEMQEVMMDEVSVVRTEQGLEQARAKIAELKERYQSICVQDRGTIYNTDLLEALELGCMLDLAETIVHGAQERRESRGAHYRDDYQARDDQNWLAHSLIYRTDAGLSLKKKSVSITRFEPKERKY
jgi:succinate dehydrogenase / fumarate reductase flavoprotein subunit